MDKGTDSSFERISYHNLLDKIIFNYFLIFKRVFKREIFEFKIGMHFHNFILKFFKGVNTKIISKIGSSTYLVRVNDFTFIARNIRVYYDLIRYGQYEPVCSYIFKKLIKKGMNVLDIGGNLGYFAIISSFLVGDSGKVYSFEPDPINFKVLNKNLKINKIQNVLPVNKCVNNEEGIFKFYIHPKIHSCHSLFKTDSGKSIDVEAIILNKMFKTDNTIFHFIKMDIEGAEINALMGMDNVIKNGTKYLLIEVNKRRIKYIQKTIRDLIEILAKNFNNYYVILDDKKLDLKYKDNHEDLITYIEQLKLDNLNLLCFK